MKDMTRWSRMRGFLFRICLPTEGALLTGQRGVGKTSAVFSAVKEAKELNRKDGINVLPVLINAPNFETDSK